MVKKSVLITLSVLIFMVWVLPSNNAYALSSPNLSAVKKIVRGIGEKMGISWSKDSLDGVVGIMAGSVDAGEHEPILPFWQFFGTTPDTIPIDELDASKYLLTPDDFNAGRDAIKEAVGKMQVGQQVPIWGNCNGGSALLSPLFYSYVQPSNYQPPNSLTFSANGGSFSFPGPGFGGPVGDRFDVTVTNWTVTQTSSNLYSVKYWYAMKQYNASGNNYYNTSGSSSITLNSDYQKWMIGVGGASFDSLTTNCNYTVKEKDIVNTSFVSNIYTDNSVVYQNIYITNNYEVDDYSTHYNEPFTPEEIDDVTKPPVEPDRDGDGIPDDVDQYPDDPNNEPIEDKPAGSSWWEWLLKPLQAIGDFIAGLAEFLLKMLIPSDGFFDGKIEGVQKEFTDKIPIIDQLGTFFGGIQSTQSGEAVKPTFNITMPEQYGGGTYSIIDFSYFDSYRTWILNFIRFTLWFIFLKRLYSRIPKMIY